MNKVYLIGNLTRDPELSETPNGIALCRFSIAVNRNYSSSDGERQTDFFNIQLFEFYFLAAIRAVLCQKYSSSLIVLTDNK